MSYLTIEWLAWIAGTTAVFWAAPARARFHVLPAIAALFLGLKDPLSLGILCGFTVCAHIAGRQQRLDALRAAIAIFGVAAVLLTFKIASAARGEDLLTDTLIPLGLSYYALRCIHYLLERFKGTIAPQRLADLIAYFFFIPTIFIGPIHRFPEFDRDRRRHHWDSAVFSQGLERILNGYVKIAFLGNFLVSQVFADWAAATAVPGSPLATYLEMVRISLNLYFQFSGYSDVAIGFALLLGFRVMENFRWPYFQKNISDFWRCWHISLTSWVREYVYTPVFAITRSPALGALATMVIIGLWHEVSINYLLWGIYHGLGIVIWQKTSRIFDRQLLPDHWAVQQPLNLLKIGATLHFVWLGFILVRTPDLPTMLKTAETLLIGWI